MQRAQATPLWQPRVGCQKVEKGVGGGAVVAEAEKEGAAAEGTGCRKGSCAVPDKEELSV